MAGMDHVKVAGDKSHAFFIAANQPYVARIYRFSRDIIAIQSVPQRTSRPRSLMQSKVGPVKAMEPVSRPAYHPPRTLYVTSNRSLCSDVNRLVNRVSLALLLQVAEKRDHFSAGSLRSDNRSKVSTSLQIRCGKIWNE